MTKTVVCPKCGSTNLMHRTKFTQCRDCKTRFGKTRRPEKGNGDLPPVDPNDTLKKIMEG